MILEMTSKLLWGVQRNSLGTKVLNIVTTVFLGKLAVERSNTVDLNNTGQGS